MGIKLMAKSFWICFCECLFRGKYAHCLLIYHIDGGQTSPIRKLTEMRSYLEQGEKDEIALVESVLVKVENSCMRLTK